MNPVQSSLKRNLAYDLPRECERARGGSAWAALLVAISIKPGSLAELLRAIGAKPAIDDLNAKRTSPVAFDACADAYSMYLAGVADGAEI